MSLAQVLLLLPSLATASDLIEKFGEPDSRVTFNHDDSSSDNYLNRQSLGFWKGIGVSTPPLLFDTLPVGTRMLTYTFEYGPMVLNPTAGGLTVCIDDHNRIVGWFYSKALVGIEKEASFRR
jgi:hypothetical protein